LTSMFTSVGVSRQINERIDMEVILYTEFSKRSNSTYNPESPGAISVSVTKDLKLKEKCNIIRPIFFVADTNKYVYAKFMGYYYFVIDDAYDINGAHYIELELDVLGTFKAEIMTHSAFVKYSSSNYNEFIVDTRISTTGKMISKSLRLSLDSYISEEETGMWLLTTFASDEDDAAKCGVVNYLFTNAEWQYFIQALVKSGQSFFGSLEQSFDDLKNCIINVAFVPFANSLAMGDYTDDVILGKWHSKRSAHYATGECITINDALPLSGLDRSDFRIVSPYTYCNLFLPFVGNVEISSEELQNAGSLFFGILYNVYTQKITYIVYVGSGNVNDNTAKIIGTYHGECGIRIPLAYLTNENAQGFIAESVKASVSLATAATGVMTGNPVVAGVGIASTLASEVSAYMKANTMSAKMMGSLSGNYGWSYCPYIKLQIFTPEVTEEPDNFIELYGRPCMKVLNIGTLTGYCETRGFSFNGSVMDSIRDMINNAMDTGVYLE